MGFKLGGQSSSSQSNATTSEANTYTPEQQALMGQLGTYFQGLVPSLSSGTLSPDVQAQKTQSADTINQNYSSLTDRMNRFYASRGYGKSGVAGKTQLQGELGRQGDLAGNESNYGGLQLQQNAQSLLASLNYAFNPTGQTGTKSQTGSSSGFGWDAGASVAFSK